MVQKGALTTPQVYELQGTNKAGANVQFFVRPQSEPLQLSKTFIISVVSIRNATQLVAHITHSGHG
jgi:hypothetical protein